MIQIDNFVSFQSIALTIIFSLWLYWLWSRRKLYKFVLDFPGKLGLPFIGCYHMIKHPDNLLKGVGKFFEDCSENNICFWLCSYPIFCTKDPEVIDKILKSPECIEKARPLYDPLHYALEGGILTSPVKKWRFNRKNISPIFKQKTLLSLFPIINRVKNEMVKDFENIADNGEHVILETILKNIFTLASETTMGKKTLVSEEYRFKVIQTFLDILKMVYLQLALSCTQIHKVLRFLPEFTKRIQILHEYVKIGMMSSLQEIDANQERNKILDQETEKRSSEQPFIFVDQIHKLIKEKKFGLKDVVSESFTLVVASLETTANTLHSAIIFLSMHPAIQEHLHQEIKTIFENKHDEVQYEHFEHLPYLQMVVLETLRLAPAFPLIGRQILTPFELPNGKILPTGFQAIISIFHLHRRKDIWGPNADNFNPDNFLDENFASKHSCAFIPFSKGVRNCIGWQYAQYALKILIIGLIRNFRFETDFKYEDLEIKDNISLAFVKNPSVRALQRI